MILFWDIIYYKSIITHSHIATNKKYYEIDSRNATDRMSILRHEHFRKDSVDIATLVEGCGRVVVRTQDYNN